MNLEDVQNILKEYVRREDHRRATAYDLWSWLPSKKEAEKYHGDYWGEFMPDIADIMSEACNFIHDKFNPSKERLAENEFYQCPCGELHEDEKKDGEKK